MLKAVFFDLDGTLLPMDMDRFVKSYFSKLSACLAPYGYDAKKLISGIWAATESMVKNDGSRFNEEAFWDKATKIFGDNIKTHKPVFDNFYNTDFENVKEDCGFNPKSYEAIKKIKDMGLKVAVATSPIFPNVAIESRIKWAGLRVDDFEFYTSYENSTFAKPNPDYYNEVCKKAGLEPYQCLMVGNDVEEDMVAEKTGMKVFLLTDCLLNKKDRDITKYPKGSFNELLEYIEKLIRGE